MLAPEAAVGGTTKCLPIIASLHFAKLKMCDDDDDGGYYYDEDQILLRPSIELWLYPVHRV